MLQNRDPFVLVLIDGDGMIFEDNLLRKGELGGKEAAAGLWNGIKDHVHNELPDTPSDCRIVTRIYANMKGLSEVCWRAGLVEKASLIEEFYRGFTGSKILFDFIDVGPGKDRADEKINGIQYHPSFGTFPSLTLKQNSSSYIWATFTASIYFSGVPTITDTHGCSSNTQNR